MYIHTYHCLPAQQKLVNRIPSMLSILLTSTYWITKEAYTLCFFVMFTSDNVLQPSHQPYEPKGSDILPIFSQLISIWRNLHTKKLGVLVTPRNIPTSRWEKSGS